MSQEILMNVTSKEVRAALLDEGQLQEIFIERDKNQRLVGNIYQGKVNRLLPAIQAAFIDIGLARPGFLHVSDITNQYENKNIQDFVTAGKVFLVQVIKDPLGTKGARLTTQLSLPSRFLVLTPGRFEVNISQKVDESERERLLALIKPGKYGGYIFRTAAIVASQQELENEKNYLDSLWEEIEAKSKDAKPRTVVYSEIPLTLRVVRDASPQLKKIRVDNDEAFRTMKAFAKRYIPAVENLIEYENHQTLIFDQYSVEEEIEKALQRHVYLKSGGYLVIDQTEAMTTIDINTGSVVSAYEMEDMIFKINLEAIDVIARHIRLRNLGGIIIVDFVDMKDPSHRVQLMQSLREAMSKDKVKNEISELSSLGLVQITRKRTQESLEHVLCEPCPSCKRRGSVKTLPTMSYTIFRDIKRLNPTRDWQGFLVLANENLVQYIMKEEASLVTALENELNKKIQNSLNQNPKQ